MSMNSGYASIPSSAVSWPSSSTVSDTRTPTVFSSTSHTISEVTNANTPIATIPMSWTPMLPPAAMHTASVPQTPAKRWAGTAPTTSSSFIVSISLIPAVQMTPPIAPMTIAQ